MPRRENEERSSRIKNSRRASEPFSDVQATARRPMKRPSEVGCNMLAIRPSASEPSSASLARRLSFEKAVVGTRLPRHRTGGSMSRTSRSLRRRRLAMAPLRRLRHAADRRGGEIRFLILGPDARRQNALALSRSPSRSSSPKSRFMFCTACPEAPLSWLSIA